MNGLRCFFCCRLSILVWLRFQVPCASDFLSPFPEPRRAPICPASWKGLRCPITLDQCSTWRPSEQGIWKWEHPTLEGLGPNYITVGPRSHGLPPYIISVCMGQIAISIPALQTNACSQPTAGYKMSRLSSFVLITWAPVQRVFLPRVS